MNSFIILVDIPSVHILPRVLAVLEGELIVVSHGHGGDRLGGVEGMKVVRTTGTEEEAVLAALLVATGDWVTVLHANEMPMLEQQLHAFDALEGWCKGGFDYQGALLEMATTGLERKPMLVNLPEVLSVLPPAVNAVLHLVPWVEDTAAKVCRSVTAECRTVRRSAVVIPPTKTDPADSRLEAFHRERRAEPKPFTWGSRGFDGVLPMAPVPELVIFNQPTAATFLEFGDSAGAQALTEGNNAPFARMVFLKARAENDRRKALDAFKVLFTHYSIHEELWRLGEFLKCLPYDLEECAEMEEYRNLYQVQVGHLDLEGSGPNAWYTSGSPSEVASVAYALGAGASQRYAWLVAECRRLGFKKAVEFGSVDGIGLFPLQKTAPDIEWHGVEVSPAAVAHGHKVAQDAGLKINLHHAGSFAEFATGSGRERAHSGVGHLKEFDAAFVFEVLEHNTPEEGQRILSSAEVVVRPGGRVFISTPCGNWSAHDEATRTLHLKKDHILAYTVARMKAFLKDKKDVFVERTENPDYREANANVQASYLVP
jgi:SAM-dependent methyltransferase